MTRQTIDTTTGAGDTGQAGGAKINANFLELYAARGYTVGNWYAANPMATPNAASQVVNTISLQPFEVRSQITISDVAARVTTSATNANFQLAIYAHDPATAKATGPALGTTANMAATNAAMISAPLSAAVVLTPGLYWAAVNTDVAHQSSGVGTSAVLTALAGASTANNAISNVTGTTAVLAHQFTQTFGTWPNLTGQAANITEVNSPRGVLLVFKVSA